MEKRNCHNISIVTCIKEVPNFICLMNDNILSLTSQLDKRTSQKRNELNRFDMLFICVHVYLYEIIIVIMIYDMCVP